jgi:hypothetical protein
MNFKNPVVCSVSKTLNAVEKHNLLDKYSCIMMHNHMTTWLCDLQKQSLQ